MKTIGLIGGMSWESTQSYYRIVNEEVRRALGGLHSAKCLMVSVDFAEIEEYRLSAGWGKVASELADAAARLAGAGADFVLLCTNTMHEVAPEIEAAIRVPLIHIADAAADELTAGGVIKVGLLGTKHTMTRPFYRERLAARGIEVLVPGEADVDLVSSVIYDELCRGIVSDASRREYVRVASELTARGAQAVLMGCTEIGLLLRPSDTEAPLYDTAVIHAKKAARLALGGD